MKISQIKMIVSTMENFAFNIIFTSTNKAFHFGGLSTETPLTPTDTAIFYLTYKQACLYYYNIQEYGDEAMKSLFNMYGNIDIKSIFDDYHS